jgi:hypothetical protein
MHRMQVLILPFRPTACCPHTRTSKLTSASHYKFRQAGMGKCLAGVPFFGAAFLYTRE